ncbi:lysostaphin resistance A-like protein [Chloroflexota bacterium]
MKTALAYLLAITIAEVFTVTIGPFWSIICHIILLVALLLHSALASRHNYQHLLLSLALVPLIRFLSLSMPLADIPQVWWYPIIYLPLLAATFQVIHLLDYELTTIGLNLKKFSIQLVIALSGFVFGFAEYFILVRKAEITGSVLQETWLLSAFLLMVTTGFVEELIFRGVLQRTATQMFGWWGIVYVSFLFAVVHLIHNSLLDIVLVFVIAMFFGWAVKKTGSLFGVILSHGITNIVLFLVVPILF